MAKLIGQFTTPSLDAQNNKTHKPFQHGVVFVFTGATKVTRETDAKGKYSFDLANGEYEVSVYLKGNTEKDRFDMRAGEKFSVTATTTADALEKWLQVIGAGGKDELATYYENLLAQMQKLYQDTKAVRDEMVGNSVGGGRWLKEGAGGFMTNIPPYAIDSVPYNKMTSFTSGTPLASWLPIPLRYGGIIELARVDTPLQLGIGHTSRVFVRSGSIGFAGKDNWYEIYGEMNTTVDSNGNIKVASPIIKLFNDHIESNDSFKEKPIFEKMGTGVYKITNTLGLAKEGWYIETPKDKNGLPYFMVDWEQDEESQDVIIRVFKKKLDLETLDFVNGDPVDIGQDQRWIDLRFHEEQEADDEELLTQPDNLDESAH